MWEWYVRIFGLEAGPFSFLLISDLDRSMAVWPLFDSAHWTDNKSRFLLENQNYPPTASLWKHPIPFLVQVDLCPCFFSSAAVAVVAIPININLYNSTLSPINLASLQKKPFANRQSEKLFDTCRTKMSIDSSRKTRGKDPVLISHKHPHIKQILAVFFQRNLVLNNKHMTKHGSTSCQYFNKISEGKTSDHTTSTTTPNSERNKKSLSLHKTETTQIITSLMNSTHCEWAFPQKPAPHLFPPSFLHVKKNPFPKTLQTNKHFTHKFATRTKNPKTLLPSHPYYYYYYNNIIIITSY